MSIHNNYNPYPIPNRKQFEENRTHTRAHQTLETVGELDYEPFAEIEIGRANPDFDAIPVPQAQSVNYTANEEKLKSGMTPVSQTQSVSPVIDEKRALFYSMRQIARDNMSFNDYNSKAFYYQAMFMKDFEDDYTGQKPFSAYYPCYQQMGYEQLRTYFTWRTQVRKGNITSTSAAYAFIYIYELLNNVGVAGPEDGLNKLVAFWQGFRVYDTVVDRYVLQWIKDYHIYYHLSQSFRAFAGGHHLLMYYPAVFGYDSGRQDSLDIFAGISRYNIKKSIFYNGQTKKMLNDCFYFILNRFRELFRDRKKCFEDLIFYPLVGESAWAPFSRSLFYPVYRQQDRQVIISEREIYNCTHNRWTYKTVILSEYGRQLIGYIMKEMESSLRKSVKFRHKLFANPDMCGGSIRMTLENMGIVFPQFIQKLVSEFYTIFTRRIISVDIGNLKQIRKEALQTQKKLTVPEETEKLKETKETEEPEESEKSEETDIMDVKDNKFTQKAAVVALPVSDAWDGFKEVLTQIELDALKIILRDGDVKAFATQNMIMLEVLADGINQKAMDCVGDTVLELDDIVTVYEEYRVKLMEMVK